jgi:hypothetical protein
LHRRPQVDRSDSGEGEPDEDQTAAEGRDRAGRLTINAIMAPTIIGDRLRAAFEGLLCSADCRFSEATDTRPWTAAKKNSPSSRRAAKPRFLGSEGRIRGSPASRWGMANATRNPPPATRHVAEAVTVDGAVALAAVDHLDVEEVSRCLSTGMRGARASACPFA